MAAPHVSGAAALLAAAAPGLERGAGQVGADVHRRARPGATPHARPRRSVLLEGAGLIDVGRADDAARLHRPAVALVPLPERQPAAPHRGRCSSRSRTRATASGRGRSSSRPQSATAGRDDRPPVPRSRSRPAATRCSPPSRARRQTRAAGDDYGFIVLRKGDVTRRIPYEFTVERPGLESVTP